MKIFQDFPFLRRIIGDHGEKITKVQPINSRMKGFLGDQDIHAYLIMDTQGWRRELVPLTVDTIVTEFDNVTIRFDSFKFYDDYYPIGLAFFDRKMDAWVVNPFPQSPKWVTPEDTLMVKYTLDRDRGNETYSPYEDLEPFLEQ